MYTRCTHCDTVFRVTPQQLQVSSGKVRCGRCNEVFDAFSSLTAQLPSAAHQEIEPPPPIERFEMPPPPTWRASTPDSSGAHAPPVPSSAIATSRDQTGPIPVPEPVREAPLAATAPAREPDASAKAARLSVAVEEPELTLPDALFTSAAPARAHWVWGAGSAILALLAIAQLAWVFATPLAHRMPGLRSSLEAFCAGSGCSVALPRLPDQLFIEASDLQLLDAARPNEVLLTCTIRNRAPLAQAYPLVELTLTGAANQVAARKVFQPREYLQRGSDPARGIGANQEVTIRLYLSTGALRAAGYRLYLFFA
jgi:predicted Zn finger-like uncharacterized protein